MRLKDVKVLLNDITPGDREYHLGADERMSYEVWAEDRPEHPLGYSRTQVAEGLIEEDALFMVEAPDHLERLVGTTEGVLEVLAWLDRLAFTHTEATTGEVRRRLRRALLLIDEAHPRVGKKDK